MFQRCEFSCDQSPEPENKDEHLFLKRPNYIFLKTTDSPVIEIKRLFQNVKRVYHLTGDRDKRKVSPLRERSQKIINIFLCVTVELVSSV
jgi:hypothetical protein